MMRESNKLVNIFVILIIDVNANNLHKCLIKRCIKIIDTFKEMWDIKKIFMVKKNK